MGNVCTFSNKTDSVIKPKESNQENDVLIENDGDKNQEKVEQIEMSKEDLQLFVSQTTEPSLPLTKDSIVNTIISKFTERSNMGYIKYGKTLDRTDLSTADWIKHMQEELMDAILYLERLRKNMDMSGNDVGGSEATGSIGDLSPMYCPPSPPTPPFSPPEYDTVSSPPDYTSHFILFGEHKFSDVSKDEEEHPIDDSGNKSSHDYLETSNHSLPEQIDSCLLLDIPEIAPSKLCPEVPTYKQAIWEESI